MSLKADPAIKHFTAAASAYKIPCPGGIFGATTKYINVCANVPEEGQIVAFEPVITAGHHAVVHHAVVFASHEPCGPEQHMTDDASSLEEATQGRYLWLYAPGTGPHVLPSDIGLPVGAKRGMQALVVNLHYDNPERRRDLVDSSGVRFHYTTKRRRYDLGVISRLYLGHI